MKKAVILFILLIIFTAASARAQFVPDPLSITASPLSPSPGEHVTITANTPTFDKNTALFEWTVDGKDQPNISGIGADSITVTAGTLGSSLRVGVAVTQRSGATISDSVTLPVSDLSLTWYAETYTPAWYKGKALPMPNSVVNIVAIPQIIVSGKTISPANLVYQWGLDREDSVVNQVGAQTFRIRVSDRPGVQHTVHVIIQDIDKTIRKEGLIFIRAQTPHVVVYPVSPLGGPEIRSANSFATAKRGLLDFLAEPFFFNTKIKNDLSYAWTVAGNALEGNPQNPYFLTIDTTDNPPTQVSVNAEVTDPKEDVVPSFTGSLSLILQ